MTEAHYLLHLARRGREHDDGRLLVQMRQPVTFVREQLERIGQDPVGSAQPPQFGDEPVIDHAATPSVDSKTS
jgi:hypothetical protein